ncbi:MAG: LptF/LptG family permease [Spirochaetota bacterium]
MKRRYGRFLPGTFDMYISREYLFSFIVSFLFFFVVFFVNQLLLMAEDILSKKAPIRDVMLLLLYATPSVIAMSVPFASLVGALMASGRLASDSELLVLHASGVRPRRIFLPFIVLGMVLSLVSFAVNDYFLPLGTLEFGKLYRRLLVTSPALELQPFSSRRYKDISVVTGSILGNTISSVLIFDKTDQGRDRVISAVKAKLETSQETGEMVLKLEDVWTQTLKSGETGRFEYTSCATMEYRIALSEGDAARGAIGPREMSSTDLGRSIAAKEGDLGTRKAARALEIEVVRSALDDAYERALLGSGPWEGFASSLTPLLATLAAKTATRIEDRNLDLYKLEYYKKYSIPAGAAIFVILSFPIGARAKRSGRSVGFGIGLLIAVLYWALLIGGQTLGTRLGFSPFCAMWFPDLIVFLIGVLTWIGLKGSR